MGIVRQIIFNQKGFLKTNTSPETGPTFQFTLPFAIGRETGKGRGKFPQSIGNAQASHPRALKVLVLEERPIAQQKKGWGSKVYVTNDPQRALALLERFSFDLVIIDLLRPVADWDILVKGIRNSGCGELGKIVIIALTTVTVHGKGKHSGINGSIVLPKGQEELVDKGATLKKLIKMTEKMESPNIGPKGLSPEMDLQPILAECMGEIDLLEELIVLYKRNVLEFIGAVKHHMGGPDFEQIQFAAHKMKAGLAMMKTYGLHKIVVQMHHNCITDKDHKYLTFLYNCFLEEYPLVEQAIDEAVRKLKK
jgi:CheY-like chemotaxis protein